MERRYGVPFDLDGTLAGNEHLKALSFTKVIEELGGESDPSLYKEVMGQSGVAIREHFARNANAPIDLDEYFGLFRSIYDGLLRTDLVIKPGVTRLLSDLISSQFALAIVSSAYPSRGGPHPLDSRTAGLRWTP